MKKMNKLFIAMFVAGSFALLLGSCKKNNTATSLTVGLPQFEEELDSKAYIDYANGNVFRWNANDEIAVYNLDNGAPGQTAPQRAIYKTTAAAEGQAKANFDYDRGTQIGDKLKAGYFVFYPVEKVEGNELRAEDNYQYFTVPGSQEYTKTPGGTPTVDPAGMATACTLSNLNGGFTLKHIFGALKLRLKGTGNVTKIVVEDNRFNLQGTVAMRLHMVDMDRFTAAQNYFIGTDDPDHNDAFLNYWNAYRTDLLYITNAPADGHQMTLNCPTPVALNRDTETLFFIGLRPGALKYGFKIYVYTNNPTTPAYTYTSDASWHYGIKAGIVKNLALSF